MVPAGSKVRVTIKVRDPQTLNPAGDNPRVNRLDLIVGDITGIALDPSTNSNSSTRVLKRFTSQAWVRKGEYITMSETFFVSHSLYVRVRGTNTDEVEPEKDPPAENPWQDLWFYSNPVFVNTLLK